MTIDEAAEEAIKRSLSMLEQVAVNLRDVPEAVISGGFADRAHRKYLLEQMKLLLPDITTRLEELLNNAA